MSSICAVQINVRPAKVDREGTVKFPHGIIPSKAGTQFTDHLHKQVTQRLVKCREFHNNRCYDCAMIVFFATKMIESYCYKFPTFSSSEFDKEPIE